MTQNTVPDRLVVRMDRAGDGVNVGLEGRLEAASLPLAWEQIVVPLVKAPAKKITVDGAKLTYCDGAGLGLFAELRRLAAEAKGEVVFVHLSPRLERLVAMSLLEDPMAGGLAGPKKVGFVTEIGETAAELLWDQRELVAFVGELTATLGWAAAHPGRVRYRDFFQIARKAGADALPVVSLLGFLVGLILSFQMAGPLERYGADNLIPNVVGFSIIRELGPLITAILLAGRSGAAFAAEIGTMKVTEELAALKTMGLEPVRFLVLPRVLAAVLVTPLLATFNMFLGLVGGCVVMLGRGSTIITYVHTVRDAITPADYLGGLFKAMVFGLIVAAVGCLRGTQTESGPGAVGDSTTRAVVAGIVLTIAADAILGAVYYCLGI